MLFQDYYFAPSEVISMKYSKCPKAQAVQLLEILLKSRENTMSAHKI